MNRPRIPDVGSRMPRWSRLIRNLIAVGFRPGGRAYFLGLIAR